MGLRPSRRAVRLSLRAGQALAVVLAVLATRHVDRLPIGPTGTRFPEYGLEDRRVTSPA